MLPIDSLIFIAWQRLTSLGSSKDPKGKKLPRIHLFSIDMKVSEKTVGMVLAPSDLDDRFDLAKIWLSLMVDRH